MWKKFVTLLMIGTLSISLIACGEKPDSGKKEEPKKETSSETVSKVENVPKEEKKEEELSVEVLNEYTFKNDMGHYTYHFIVVKNNSSETVDVETSSIAHAEDKSVLSAADSEVEAIGAGCTSIMEESFETSEQISYYETKTKVKQSKYYESVIQDLSYEESDVENGAVFQVTNNGEKPAEFVEGYALFFNGDNVVSFEETYFVDDDSELKPGETISEQLPCYDDFDRVEFYLQGRRDRL